MMYNHKLAVAIKSNSKVLREFKDTVYVPFGAEYGIFIKNLDSVRVSVSVSIDGVDVADGDTFVINGNSSLELERFLKNGNLNHGNKFKFIERSSCVEKTRGIEVEDGLIRVEFQFEKRLPKVEPVPVWVKPCPYYYPYLPPHWNGGVFYGSSNNNNIDHAYGFADANLSPPKGSNVLRSRSVTAQCSNVSSVNSVGVLQNTCSANPVGITVPGSISDQKFQTASSFPIEEEKHVIVLKMLGENEQGKLVNQPINVKKKPKCVTCGHVNKAVAKFCSECGTGLEIV